MADWLPQQLESHRCRNLQESTYSSLSSSPPTLFLLLAPWFDPRVHPKSLLRLPNGDESWRCVRDLTTLRHRSRKAGAPRMNWLNGIFDANCGWVSGLGPWNPIVVQALCPDTCCSRFIHSYQLQVGNWLPEGQQHTDSQRGYTCQGL